MATFFPAQAASGHLANLIESLCNALYDSLRPQYIQLHAPDDLADLVLVLREAVRAEAASHRDAPSTVLLEAVVQRITADVQERLLFRAMVCLLPVCEQDDGLLKTSWPRCRSYEAKASLGLEATWQQHWVLAIVGRREPWVPQMSRERCSCV